MRDVKAEVKRENLNTRNSLFLCSGFCLSKCLFVQLHVSQTELQEIQKKPFTFSFLSDGILTNKSHFKETRSWKYLNFPAHISILTFTTNYYYDIIN